LKGVRAVDDDPVGEGSEFLTSVLSLISAFMVEEGPKKELSRSKPWINLAMCFQGCTRSSDGDIVVFVMDGLTEAIEIVGSFYEGGRKTRNEMLQAEDEGH